MYKAIFDNLKYNNNYSDIFYFNWKSYWSIGAITELVSDWLVSWYLSADSEISNNPKVALGQVYIKDYLTDRYPKSLSPEMLNTAVFWAACSAWASSTKKSVSDKTHSAKNVENK